MLRMVGAMLLMAGSCGFAFAIAAINAKQKQQLRQLRNILQEMEWELKFRLTPLPQLCRIGADAGSGKLRLLFYTLAERLELGTEQNISACMNGLSSDPEFSRSVRICLRELGQTLGRYDLEGQLQGFRAVTEHICRELQVLNDNGKERIRSYQTLVLCAGAALVILMI